ncbi:MAG: outer membrane beta-barrel protein [Salaquimonas sp.]
MKRIFFITSLLLSTTAGIAQAADMEYPVNPQPAYTNVEYGSGWYLRGDIGYAKAESTLSYYSDARYDYDNQSVGDSSSWSIGFGYNFNDMLRADLTYETSDGHDWNGTSVGTICGGGAFPGDCYSEDSANFDRDSLMANAYVSLGNYHGFSPYVGAGIGVTHVQWNNYNSNAFCTVAIGETCDYGAHSGVGVEDETYFGGATTYNTQSTTALTYALTTGFDYRIDDNWVLDMGYKWTAIDGGVVIAADTNGIGAPQGDSNFDMIHIHEVKFGVRYEVW